MGSLFGGATIAYPRLWIARRQFSNGFLHADFEPGSPYFAPHTGAGTLAESVGVGVETGQLPAGPLALDYPK